MTETTHIEQLRADMTETAYIEPHGVDGIQGRPAAELPFVRPRKLDSALWLNERRADQPDVHAAFRCTFQAGGGAVTVRIVGVTAFAAWLDGEPLVDGPVRFAPAHPEYQEVRISPAAGLHVIAVHVRSDRLTTRATADLPGFLWVEVEEDGRPLPTDWRCRRMSEYRATGVRISPLLGWVEWADEVVTPAWRQAGFDDSAWARPVSAELPPGLSPVATAGVLTLPVWPEYDVSPAARGVFREEFTGYELDDLAIQFASTDLNPNPDDDVDGVWQRFDLGRVRIGALSVEVDSTEPAEVKIGYAERLWPDGRALPVTPHSAGPTRMIQRFQTTGGRTYIEPLQSIGGQYVEVRVRGTNARILRARFRERDLLGEPTGAFRSPDELLNRIWQIGADTLRSSSEDSIVDSVRERGEWVGDVVESAADISAVAYGDLRLVERALLHAAATARADGLVAGCGPGELLYLGTYAAQWISGCVKVADLTGDPRILFDLFECGRANLTALLDLIGDDGSTAQLPWPFVDWGHRAARDGVDLAVLLHLYRAGQAFQRWCALVKADEPELLARVERFHGLVRGVLESGKELDYHEAVLAAHVGLREPEDMADGILAHIRAAFPFDRTAPRLRGPVEVNPATVTPYFLHYALPVVLAAGRVEEVLDIWRRGWGWMIERGATTWWEVFDDRWSRCHSWAGAPTWQLSRYLLGLRSSLTTAGPSLTVELYPGSLDTAEGTVPTPFGPVHVHWRRSGRKVAMTLLSATDLVIDGVPRAAGTTTLALHDSGHGIFRASTHKHRNPTTP
jgi:alpha-L-rhamnosidase